MRVKDYYKILEVQPSAREDEIKRSFRRLALQYHPDVNNGETHADAWYREIQEAYEVLTNPQKKANYLQERWLVKSKGLHFEDTTPLTPVFIELKFNALRKMVGNMDHFRMDHEKLKAEISGFCSEERIEVLVRAKDDEINRKILDHLFYCVSPLHFKYLAPIRTSMIKIAGQSGKNLALVSNWYRDRKNQYRWEKNQWWILALGTLLACLLIVLLTRKH